jgi:organic hydroperoxide reductase OsmC/OhrA
MDAFPHTYTVSASGGSAGNLKTGAEGIPGLVVAAPAAFDGPGDQWSPEDLLMASIANCLILSFKAIAGASRLEWLEIHCESSGLLDKVERQLRFTSVSSRVRLVVPSADTVDKATRLLEKAESNCIIMNSLNIEGTLECDVVVAGV